MRILSKHIVGEFIRIFLAVLIGILVVYLCIDFLQKADRFIKYKANIVQVATYFLYSLPGMAASSLPIAALMALLATLQSVVRSRLDLQAEISALRHQLGVLQREAPRGHAS